MQVILELTKTYALISWIEKFEETKSLKNISWELKSNIVYLEIPLAYLTLLNIKSTLMSKIE